MYRLIVLLMAVGVLLGALQPSWVQPAPVQPTPTLSGTVQQYLLTPHGEVEGLLLTDGTAVTITGFLGPVMPQGRAVKALTITNTATGQTVVDQPPTSRPLPPDQRGLTRTPLTVSG